MKLLLDQNLSPSLIPRLQDLFPDSAHVQEAHLDRAPDNIVWEFARDEGFAIVTQDSDFADRALLYGYPPKIIWLRFGNMRRKKLEEKIKELWGRIVQEIDEYDLLEIHDNRIEGLKLE